MGTFATVLSVAFTLAAGQAEPAEDAGIAELDAGLAPAVPAEAPTDVLLESLFEMESQLNQFVVSATRTARSVQRAPAVISVISSDEIAARAYGSVAEALRTVPGFYDVYDLAFHNVGVRGINGGARAQGNVLKVMIDGMPVSFLPTTGNFFGEELVPMAAIDRIEIIRGPASALYGANAFLGVVNIITRSRESADGLRVGGSGQLVRDRFGGGGHFLVGLSGARFELMLSGQARVVDRSGLTVPASSPRLEREDDPIAARGASRNDLARPASLVGRFVVKELLGGTLTTLASLQSLDSNGEFQDFGPLSHATRINLLNVNARSSWFRPLGDAADLTVALAVSHGTVGPSDQLSLGRADSFLRRTMAGTSVSLSVESKQVLFNDRLMLTEGVEGWMEDHLLQRFDRVQLADVTSLDGTVLRTAGTVVPGDGRGERFRMLNAGVYLQGILDLTESWSIVAGGRFDFHNVFRFQPAARVGVVWAPKEGAVSAKLLMGTSWKAPSAEQLFTRPVTVLDVRGNPTLKAQLGRTVEGSVSWRLPENLGELTLNAFFMSVGGRVEYVQTGLYLEAQNVQTENVLGGELEGRLVPARWLQLRASVGVARTISVEESDTVVGLPSVINPLFPQVQVHGSASFVLPLDFRVGPEVSFISARPASQSNALEFGSAYSVPAYGYVGFSASTPVARIFGDRATSASLRVSDVINRQWVEPGFGGIDVPTQGVTAQLTVTQEL